MSPCNLTIKLTGQTFLQVNFFMNTQRLLFLKNANQIDSQFTTNSQVFLY